VDLIAAGIQFLVQLIAVLHNDVAGPTHRLGHALNAAASEGHGKCNREIVN